MNQQSGDHRNIVDVLTEDHREVEQLFEQAKNSSDSEERRGLTDQIIAELVRHSVAEEQHLYPAVRDHLEDGDQLADHEISEHAEAERIMKELEGLEASDPRFSDVLQHLEDEISHHVGDEERDIFPALNERADDATLVELGDKIQDAKRLAPTRPHPSAPDTPPLNKILAPGAGLVDRVRDHLAGRDV